MKTLRKIMVLGMMSVFAGKAGAVGGIADITVYDRAENRTLPVYVHDGRYYVVGRPGNEYQVQVRNRGRGDILAVIAVDGVNVVSGETANWNQTGYVLDGYQAFDLRGWRKSMDRTAAFYFTRLGDSYAARTGRPDNVGVIGVAVFRRKYEAPLRIEPPLRREPLSPRDESPFPRSGSGDAQPPAADSAAASAEGSLSDRSTAKSAGRRGYAPALAQDSAQALRRPPALSAATGPLGTGHGRSEASSITYTEFQRGSSTPDEIITLHYDTYENLLAQGVIVRPPLYARPAPVPFPGQIVPDPR